MFSDIVLERMEKTQPTHHRGLLKSPASLDAASMEDTLFALIKRNEELISLNESKDEFIAITSHQLRTPATAVKQYIALLLEDYAGPLTRDQKVFLQKAYENNERQLRIVDDILRVAQLDLGKVRLSLHKVDLREIVHQVLENFKTSLELHELSIKLIEPDVPVKARIDAGQYRMVVENLLENAVNYSAKGKPITVILEPLKNSRSSLTIADCGVGIKKADLPKLFKKFSRVNNPLSNAVSGTGLGLYYCKKIIELHGGTIEARSVPGKGSQFIVTI